MGFAGLPTWGDYDNEGYVDLFRVNASSSTRTNNALFHRDGGGRFAQVWDAPVGNSTGDAHWAAWSGCDNEGRLDLLVTFLRGYQLMPRNPLTTRPPGSLVRTTPRSMPTLPNTSSPLTSKVWDLPARR